MYGFDLYGFECRLFLSNQKDRGPTDREPIYFMTVPGTEGLISIFPPC